MPVEQVNNGRKGQGNASLLLSKLQEPVSVSQDEVGGRGEGQRVSKGPADVVGLSVRDPTDLHDRQGHDRPGRPGAHH